MRSFSVISEQSIVEMHNYFVCRKEKQNDRAIATKSQRLKLDSWLSSIHRQTFVGIDSKSLSRIVLNHLCAASAAQWLVLSLSERKVVGSNPPMVVRTQSEALH